MVRGVVYIEPRSEKRRKLVVLTRLEYKYLRLPRAQRPTDVDTRTVIVVEAFPLSIDVS